MYLNINGTRVLSDAFATEVHQEMDETCVYFCLLST